MSSAELYHRLLSSAWPPDPSVFAYELATVSSALFHADGSMRKSPKSVLVQHILQMNVCPLQVEQCTFTASGFTTKSAHGSI